MTGDRPNEPKGHQMSVQHGPPVQQSSPVQLGAGQSRASADEHRPGLLPEVLRVSYNDRELRVVRDAAQPTGLTASGFLAVAGLAFAGTRVSPPTSTERALLSEALRLGAVLTDYAISLKEATAVVNNHGAGVSIAVLSALAGCTRAAAHVDEFTVQLMHRVR